MGLTNGRSKERILAKSIAQPIRIKSRHSPALYMDKKGIQVHAAHFLGFIPVPY